MLIVSAITLLDSLLIILEGPDDFLSNPKYLVEASGVTPGAAQELRLPSTSEGRRAEADSAAPVTRVDLVHGLHHTAGLLEPLIPEEAH